jgi:hypothetical protein
MKINYKNTSHITDVFIFGTILMLVFAVPLVFPLNRPNVPFGEYKSMLLHFGAGAISVALLVNYVARFRGPEIEYISCPTTLSGWWTSSTKMLVGGLLLVVTSHLISSVMSPAPRLSFYGANENFSGRNGYDLVSLFILFIAVSTHVRSTKRLQVLASTFAVTASLVAIYALAQHFGWDEIGGRQHATRVVSSFGNTLNLAGFLVITIPLTLGLCVLPRTSIVLTMVMVGALGLQIAALWLTGGRGAYLALVISIASSSLLVFRFWTRVWIGKSLGTLAMGAIVAMVIVVLPASPSGATLNRAGSIVTEIRTLIDEPSVTSSGGLQAGGLQARRPIWEAALRVFGNPALPASSSGVPKTMRYLVGVGPEMFLIPYPLAAQPSIDIRQQYDTHNIALQVLVTTGIVGLIALGIFGFSVLRVGSSILRQLAARNPNNMVRTLLAVFILSAVVAKGVEMQTGVPRVSDLVPAFVVLGMFVSVSRSSELAGRVDGSHHAPRTTESSRVIPVVLVSLAVITLLSSIVGFDMRRVSVVRILGNGQAVLTSKQQVVLESKAGDFGSFIFDLSEVHFDASLRMYEEGDLNGSHAEAIEAWELLLRIEKINPHDLSTQLALAKVAATQVERGDSTFREEMSDRYRRIATNYPAFPTLVGTAATALANIGEHRLAIDAADQAIMTESMTKPWAKAWYAKGLSEYLSGSQEQGVNSLLTATVKEPGSTPAKLAHGVLAQIYFERGDNEIAEIHAKAAE